MTDEREAELKRHIDSLVASSVETHRILETPPSAAITLVERATQVMAELKDLRAFKRQAEAEIKELEARIDDNCGCI